MILFIPRRLIVPLLVTAIIVAIVGREIDYRMKPEGYRYLVLTPYSFDALGLGGLLAVWQQRGTRSALLGRLMKTILLISVASALLISVLRLNVSPPVAYTLTLLPSAALVFGASVGITGIAGKIASFSPLRYVGRISYGIYLWHLPVLAALMKAASMAGIKFLPAGAGQFFVATGATFVVASLSWHYFEKPIRDLKERFPYTGRASEAVPRGRKP